MGNHTTVRRVIAEKKQGFNVEALALLADISTDLSIKTLTQIRIFNRYDVSGISDEEYEKAKPIVFSEPPVDYIYDEEVSLSDSCFVLSIEALPGQYDQRADSAAQCIQFITEGERPLVKTARVLSFYGQMTEDEKAAVSKYLINPVEARAASLEKPDTLVDNLESPKDIEIMDGFTDSSEVEIKKLLSTMGLAMSLSDLKFVQDFFKKEKRNPTITELRVLDTYWSDHCRHTTFNTELTDITFSEPDSDFGKEVIATYEHYLETREDIYGERLLQKPVCLMDLATMAMRHLKKEGKLQDLDESEEINACSIRTSIEIDGEKEDYIVMFKNETHNHPTEIEPFGGAATCLGGAIRDPLSGRSYVYQAMRVTGAGDPRKSLSETLPGKLSQKKIVRTAAAGYSAYGNQIGLATGLVDEIYHPGYVAKRMEVGAVIGAAPASSIHRETPRAGDIVLLVGGRTGRDGIGGATGSSKAHDEKSVMTCGSEVQKGNPPTERKIQRLFRNPEAAKKIIRCNDFGAGGVSVAVGELADGLSIDLDMVPKKYEGLDGTEIAISESQERMAIVVHPEEEASFSALAKEENLEVTKIAVVLEEARMMMTWRGKTIVDLPRSFIDTNGAASYAKVLANAPDMENPYPDSLPDTYVKSDFEKSLLQGLSSLSSCSRKGLAERFDSTIGAASVLMPYGGKYQLTQEEGMVAKIPVLQGTTDAATYMSYGFSPYLSEWSPYHGAYYAVVESLLRLSAMGMDASKARLTFQEYFERMSKEEAWGKPLLALLGAYRAQIDFGTAAIGGKDSMSGNFNELHVPPTLISFAVGVGSAKNAVSAAITSAGKKLYCISLKKDALGLPDKEHTKRVLHVIHQIADRRQLEACAVVKEGGIAVRAAQMLMGNRLGISFSEKLSEEKLFSRALGSILLLVKESNSIDKIEMVGGFEAGSILSEPVVTYKNQSIPLDSLIEAFEGTLEPIFPTRTKKDTLISSFTESRKPKVNKVRSTPPVAKPRVFIPVFPGTNCEYDSAMVFEKAGAIADVFVIKNQTPSDISESLSTIKEKINKANMIMFPGGFSGGDEPEGSGKFIAATFRNPFISEAVQTLLEKRDGLIMGICNGFQALVKLGLLPYGEIKPLQENDPTVTFNNIGRHQSGYYATKVVSNQSPWLSFVEEDETHWIPVSHGEGRFVAPTELIQELYRNNQIFTQYVDLEGNPASSTDFNPNGSLFSIEGIMSPDGRILGKMGHSERLGENVGKNIPGNKDQKLFLSGVRYFQ